MSRGTGILTNLMEAHMTTTEVLWAVVFSIAVLTIPIAAIAQRVLDELKLRELFPHGKSIKRLPVFFIIDLNSIPDSENGREYMAYKKRSDNRTFKIIGSAILVLVIVLMKNKIF
jgi:hypothetical protein